MRPKLIWLNYLDEEVSFWAWLKGLFKRPAPPLPKSELELIAQADAVRLATQIAEQIKQHQKSVYSELIDGKTFNPPRRR